MRFRSKHSPRANAEFVFQDQQRQIAELRAKVAELTLDRQTVDTIRGTLQSEIVHFGNMHGDEKALAAFERYAAALPKA